MNSFFLCIFSISLRRRELSESHSYFTMPGPRAIYSSERFSRNVLSSSKKLLVTSRHVTSRHVTSRHVTSRFVTVNLFSNKRTPNGYYVPPWVNLTFKKGSLSILASPPQISSFCPSTNFKFYLRRKILFFWDYFGVWGLPPNLKTGGEELDSVEP